MTIKAVVLSICDVIGKRKILIFNTNWFTLFFFIFHFIYIIAG